MPFCSVIPLRSTIPVNASSCFSATDRKNPDDYKRRIGEMGRQLATVRQQAKIAEKVGTQEVERLSVEDHFEGRLNG